MNTKLNPKPNNQVGGDHYSRLAIEPIQFIEANGLNYCEGNAVKYISRWRNKNGLEDLNKAKWYVERLIQIEEQRLEEERRDELTAAINEHCTDTSPVPCEACDCDAAESDLWEEQDVTTDLADEYITDLHFFGWSEMSSDARLEAQVEARRKGVDIISHLRDLAESCSDDEARIIWTRQDGEEEGE